MNYKTKKSVSLVTALCMTALAVSSNACVFAEDDSTTETVYFHDECENCTVEDATITDNIYSEVKTGFTGTGFVWFQSGGTITFEVTVPKTDMYDISCVYMQELSEDGRLQYVNVNGNRVGEYNMGYCKEWTDYDFGVFKLQEGTNTIQIQAGYGFAYFDSVTVKDANLPALDVQPTLADKDATKETQSLMNYLCDVYGKHTIAGQQEIYGGGHTESQFGGTTDADGNGVSNYEYEFEWIKDLSGSYPAIRGFDFMNYNPLYGWEDGTTDRAIEWVNSRGGIATGCWHINVPKDFANYTVGEPVDWKDVTYVPSQTDFDTANAVVEGTKEHEYVMLAIEDLAEQLTKLQEANVPIILRPFHEAEGNGGETNSWFWWGKAGSTVYKQLWQMLYTTLTEDYGLHNIIWEFNSYDYDTSPNWYPGDDYVDIIGYDKYNTVYNRHDGLSGCPNEDAISKTFYALVKIGGGNKLVSMPENDTVPSLENLTVEKAGWLYFCPWYDNGQSNFLSGSEYNNPDTLKEMYTSDYCIMLDELPSNLYSGYKAGEPTQPDEPDTTTTSTSTTTEEPSTNITTTAEPSDTDTTTTEPSETSVTTIDSTIDSDDTTTQTTVDPNLGTSGDYLAGDVNLDGKVSTADLLVMKKYLLGMTTLTGQSLVNGDMNQDQKVTTADLLSLKKVLLGITK